MVKKLVDDAIGQSWISAAANNPTNTGSGRRLSARPSVASQANASQTNSASPTKPPLVSASK